VQPGAQAFPPVVFHASHTDLNVTEVFEIQVHHTIDGGLETQAGLGL